MSLLERKQLVEKRGSLVRLTRRLGRQLTRRDLREMLRTTAVAATVSGLPSTVHALASGRDPLEAAQAAGTLLLPRCNRRAKLLLAAIPIHLGISLMWTALLSLVLPRRHGALSGGFAGIAIAVVDLSLAGRRFPRVRALPLAPQVADHVLFGAIVGVLSSPRTGA